MKKRDRIHQVKRWLAATSPTEPPTRLRVVKRMPKDHQKDVGLWDPNTSIIYLLESASISEMIYSLIHEWAHARTEAEGPIEMRVDDGHDEAFDLERGRIERRFRQGGQEDSEGF